MLRPWTKALSASSSVFSRVCKVLNYVHWVAGGPGILQAGEEDGAPPHPQVGQAGGQAECEEQEAKQPQVPTTDLDFVQQQDRSGLAVCFNVAT